MLKENKKLYRKALQVARAFGAPCEIVLRLEGEKLTLNRVQSIDEIADDGSKSTAGLHVWPQPQRSRLMRDKRFARV